MNIIRDIWLCSDCMPVAVNGDYDHLDYHYSEREANQLMKVINHGLAQLPGLVPDFGGEDPEHHECRDCGFKADFLDFKLVGDDPDYMYRVCPECDSDDVRAAMFDNGEEEFSRRDCDCCGTHLAGSRFRFAQLINEDAAASA